MLVKMESSGTFTLPARNGFSPHRQALSELCTRLERPRQTLTQHLALLTKANPIAAQRHGNAL